MTEQNDTRPSGLHRKIAEIVAAVDHVEKDGYNSQQNYHFTSEAALLTAFRAEMASRNVTMFPTVVPGGVNVFNRAPDGKGLITTCVVGYTFTDGDTCEHFTASVVAQGYDTLDKGAFKAMTGALKYALRQTFMVPTGDDPENNGPSSAPHERPADDEFQENILPEGVRWAGSVHSADWKEIKKTGKTKLLVVIRVPNTSGNKDATEAVWIDPLHEGFTQVCEAVGDGALVAIGEDVSAWVGRPIDFIVTMNDKYRNHELLPGTVA